MHTTNAKIYVNDGTLKSHVNWDGETATVYYWHSDDQVDSIVTSPIDLRQSWGENAILELQPFSPALYGQEETDERPDLLNWLQANGWPVREVTP